MSSTDSDVLICNLCSLEIDRYKDPWVVYDSTVGSIHMHVLGACSRAKLRVVVKEEDYILD